MNEISEGSEVVLVKQHRYGGQIYDGEANIGSIGIVRLLGQTFCNVDWTHHPKKTRGGYENSNVDIDCLQLSYQPVTDEELEDVYKILGIG